jgi:hypothetical protein
VSTRLSGPYLGSRKSACRQQFGIDLQFLLEANGSDNYLPKDMFYDLVKISLVDCSGENITLTDVNFTFLQTRWALVPASDLDENNDRIAIFRS